MMKKAFLLVVVLLSLADAFQSPGTTGDYATGVHDFEFTDNNKPSNYAFDAKGRRIMVRSWYPACKKVNVVVNTNETAMCQSSSELGRQRKYLEPGEWEAFFFGQPEPADVLGTFTLTQSYLDAPPLTETDISFPVIIYTHGHSSRVSDNTAILEGISSHGYTVFAVGSPGYSSGVLFQDTMDVVTALDYPEIALAIQQSNATELLTNPNRTSVKVRHDDMEKFLNKDILPPIMTRLRDDKIALADYLEQVYQTVPSNNNNILHKILTNTGGLNTLLYMGYSLGGSAAGSAAQEDSRAVGSINLDGFHQTMDLFGKAVRVPLMHFFGNDGHDGVEPLYYNEFFFEPFESMGTSHNVIRVAPISPGIGHWDLTDFRNMQQFLRESFGVKTVVDGEALYEVIVDFCLGFAKTYLRKEDGWTAKMSFDKFQDRVFSVDVSHIAKWKADNFKDEPGNSEDESVLATFSEL